MNNRVKVLISIYMAGLLALVIIFDPISTFAGFTQVLIKNEKYDPNKLVIKFVAPQVDEGAWVQARDGFLKAADELDFYGLWTGSIDHSSQEMIEELYLALDEKVDGLVTCPFSPSDFDGIYQELYAANIPVINVAVDSSVPEHRKAIIQTDYEMAGEIQADALYRRAGKPLRAGVVMSNLDSYNQVVQLQELKKYIQYMEGAKIVDIREDSANRYRAYTIVENMLEENPEINALFVTEGGGLPGIAKLISDKGLKDKVTIIGMDTTIENLEAIARGDIYGVMHQDFYNMGYLAGKYAYYACLGQEIGEQVKTKTQLVTKENMNIFLYNKEEGK